jgi:sugar lactone lactonase YvrE
MKTPKTTLTLALFAVVSVSAASVAAVTTSSFQLDSADAFIQGELQGTAVHSEGAVRTGAETERVALENLPLAYSVARRGKSTFIGTGTAGAIYKLAGKKLEPFTETNELLVTSLAFGRDGALYAGTIPNGRIYRVDPRSGATKLWSTPEGAKHIWALVYDKRRGRLVAATGPEGKVFTVDGVGRAQELYKAEAAHVMTLATDGKGDLFAGTSDAALLIRIAPNGDASVVHDFPGNEVTAIDVHEGRIAVAANQFKTAPGTQFKAGAAQAKTPRPSTRPRPGVGELWRVDTDGRAEMLIKRKDTHFTSVQWGSDGAVYAGGGHEGRVFRVQPDASYSIWVDVEERQVLALDLRSSEPSFVIVPLSTPVCPFGT